MAFFLHVNPPLSLSHLPSKGKKKLLLSVPDPAITLLIFLEGDNHIEESTLYFYSTQVYIAYEVFINLIKVEV